MGAKGKSHSIPLIERFLDKIKIDHTTECWEWQSTKTRQGYGRLSVNGKYTPAHRVSYSLYVGELSNNDRFGELVCHKCDNPPCVNPFHLFKGTVQDNADDMVKKGRAVKGKEHGTMTAYKRGCRCELCVAFVKAKQREYYLKYHDAEKHNAAGRELYRLRKLGLKPPRVRKSK